MHNRNGKAPLRREMVLLNRRMMGARLIPKSDPPAFIQRPWNTWTFEQTTTGTTNDKLETSSKSIINQIIASTGLDSTAIVEIKVLDAYAWLSANSSSSGVIERTVLDTRYYEGSVSAAGTSAIRSDQRDVGTLTQPARTGYMWPANEQRNIFIKGGTETPLTQNTIILGPGTLTVRIHVLWRSSTAA